LPAQQLPELLPCQLLQSPGPAAPAAVRQKLLRWQWWRLRQLLLQGLERHARMWLLLPHLHVTGNQQCFNRSDQQRGKKVAMGGEMRLLLLLFFERHIVRTSSCCC
jgi:hypothetical protein